MRKTPQQQPTRDEASEKSSAEKLKDVFALLGLLRRRAVLAVRFRYGLLQLRAQATLLPLRGSRFWRRMERVRKVVQGFGRRFRLSWGLALCAVVMAATVLLSALVHGAPELRGLEGTPLPAESLLMLDPNRKDETMLTPGNLYDRPVAAVQTGTQSLLLRARLEETLLTIRRDENGLVVVPMPTRDPGENYSPRTVTEEAALHLLAEAGLCPKDATWAAAKAMQLPQSRLPATAQDAKILVFEKKTVENPIDSSIDLASLLPEDWDQFGVNKTTYTHMGFYDCGGGQYQPLYVVVEEPPKGSAEDPVITKISYQFYAWD
ncbi:MAG: hypothetical protein LBS96_05750, partial [Oscillospiraceae bacterium]|nr:hypothetical protein [Oscillospiraceae bacterium]